MDSSIEKFVADARQKGWSDEQTRNALVDNGWSASQVEAALSGLVVPKPPSTPDKREVASQHQASTHARPSITALQAALQHVLLWVFTLTSSIMIGIVSYALFGGESSSSKTLITYVVLELVTFAPFAFLFWRYLRRLRREPELMTGKVWSIITIVLHSVGLIGSVIAFVLVLVLVHDANTMAGLVSSAVIGLMSGVVVLAYVLANFAQKPQLRVRMWYLRFFPVLLFMLIGVLGIMALLQVGPLRADDQTRQNLVTTVRAIHDSSQKHAGAPPRSLSELSGVPSGVTYRTTDTFTYEVCANFQKDHTSSYENNDVVQDDTYVGVWSFQYGRAGENCWKFTNESAKSRTYPGPDPSVPQVCTTQDITRCITN